MRKVLIFAAALAVPAAAYAMKAAPKQPLCFASGASTYQIVASATAPDYRIRIDAEALRPDLRMQLVDRAENADFVLVDDFSGNEPSTCKSSTPIRTVTLDTAAGTPDVTVQLSALRALGSFLAAGRRGAARRHVEGQSAPGRLDRPLRHCKKRVAGGVNSRSTSIIILTAE
jgi:hypothetical protein